MNPRTPSGAIDRFTLAVCLVLMVDVAFGGATQPDAVTSAVARLASLPLLAIALWRLRPSALSWGGQAALWLLAAVVLVPLIQCLPLPPSLWSALPGRHAIVLDYAAARLPLPWLPISLSPYETQDVLIWLIPPVAMFLSALQLRGRARAIVAGVVPLAAVVAVVLGLMQVLGGPESRLRFYAVTNVESAVGFFANRNHQAALLVGGAALAPVWTTILGDRTRSRIVAGLVLSVMLLILLVVGIGVTRSRAGVLIGLPVMLAAGLLTVRGGPGQAAKAGGVGLLVAGLAGALLVGLFARAELIQRFQSPLTAELRVQTVPSLQAAARSVFPVGGGLGSFDALYRAHEPLEAVTSAYFNHAHNDVLELLIETGALGMAVLSGILLWWLWMTIAALRQKSVDLVAALSSLTIAALFAHSLVDYPLRTTALASLFAIACGLLAGRSTRESRPKPLADDRGARWVASGEGLAIKAPRV